MTFNIAHTTHLPSIGTFRNKPWQHSTKQNPEYGKYWQGNLQRQHGVVITEMIIGMVRHHYYHYHQSREIIRMIRRNG